MSTIKIYILLNKIINRRKMTNSLDNEKSQHCKNGKDTSDFKANSK